VQEYSHFRETDVMCPFKLLINGVEIEILPHFNFIVGVGRDVVNSRSPRILVIPIESLLLSPSRSNLQKDD